jgi:type IV pilus assembly protein PilV
MNPCSQNRQRGSSLIEVLVALLLSAIGLLGLAGTMAVSTTMARLSEHRSQAMQLAVDLGERMQAAAEVAREGAFDDPRAFDDVGAPSDDLPCAGDGPLCAAGDRAALETARWQDTLVRRLPQGAGHVVFDAGTDHVDVWVGWLESGMQTPVPGAAAECPDTFASAQPAPRCVHLRVAL